MGLFSKTMDRCPKCGGGMESYPELKMKLAQEKANRGTQAALSAITDLYSMNSDSYYKCKRCGYIETRAITQYGVSKRPYTGKTK